MARQVRAIIPPFGASSSKIRSLVVSTAGSRTTTVARTFVLIPTIQADLSCGWLGSIPSTGVIACRAASRPPDRQGDLTGTAGVDANRPREDDLRPAGMNYPLLPAPLVAALEPAIHRCASDRGGSPGGRMRLPNRPRRPSAPPSGAWLEDVWKILATRLRA